MELWKPGTILIVDDSKTVRESVSAILREQGHTIFEAQDGAKALWSLRSNPSIEIVLLDLEMPILNGLGLLRILRESDATRQLPVIMISSVADKTKVVDCLYAGANDFIHKPLFAQEVLVRVRNALALSRTLRELTDVARTDHLTGLANKRHLEGSLGLEMERAKRSGGKLGLIFADLDHFKLVNDKYGHLVGDEVLKSFAERLKRITRTYDTLFRYGGEEFVVVSPGPGPKELMALAERMRSDVANKKFKTSGGEFSVTASFGCAFFSPARDKTMGELLARADAALYRAKEAGRNRVVMADY